jgi:hypothetical protein
MSTKVFLVKYTNIQLLSGLLRSLGSTSWC